MSHMLSHIKDGIMRFLYYFLGTYILKNDNRKADKPIENKRFIGFLLLARPEGFEPPAFGIGIHCDIQLRHGRMVCSVNEQVILYTTFHRFARGNL